MFRRDIDFQPAEPTPRVDKDDDEPKPLTLAQKFQQSLKNRRDPNAPYQHVWDVVAPPTRKTTVREMHAKFLENQRRPTKQLK